MDDELTPAERTVLVDVVGYLDQAAVQLANAFHASNRGGFDPLSMAITVVVHALVAAQRPALVWLGEEEQTSPFELALTTNVDGAQPA